MAEKAVVASVPPRPPRHTGDQKADVVSVIEYLHDFYNSAVTAGFFINSLPDEGDVVIDPADLPDPATATVASAQKTANEAYVLALTAQATADTAPLAGSATISDPDTTVVVTFDDERPNTDYKVVAVPSGFTGAPAAGSRTVVSITKTLANFTITIEAAPGVGASVTLDWMVSTDG